MALTSPAIATALVIAVAALQVAAAAAAAPPLAPKIGLPGCNTTCGDVSVPYPFGIQPGCFREGYNLTCDTSSGSPRLLLGDGSLRVVNIYPQNSTVRVLRDGSMVNGADNITSDGMNVMFAPMFAGGHYRMSYRNNELVLFGCDVVATLVAGNTRLANDSGPIVVGCVSFCSGGLSYGGKPYCSSEGCCQASTSGDIDWFHMATELHLWPLERRNDSDLLLYSSQHVSAFLAEKGWLDKWTPENATEKGPGRGIEPTNDIPLILRWDIMQGLGLSESDEKHYPYFDSGCGPRKVANLCKSNNSRCVWDIEVYMCECTEGYEGNPYIVGGCQDIDECKNPQDNECFGDCTNTDGSIRLPVPKWNIWRCRHKKWLCQD